jgi:hypothetical protein
MRVIINTAIKLKKVNFMEEANERKKVIFGYLEEKLKELRDDINDSTDIKSQLSGYVEKFKEDFNTFMQSKSYTMSNDEKNVIDNFCAEVLTSDIKFSNIEYTDTEVKERALKELKSG